jgi:hypothetical protein
MDEAKVALLRSMLRVEHLAFVCCGDKAFI